MSNLNYEKRFNKLMERRHGGILTESERYFEKSAASTKIKYVKNLMVPVDEKYTKNTFLNGERVKNQLLHLNMDDYGVEFEYQGSVTNNTHIKAHSDIDLLVITKKFETLEAPQTSLYPYEEDPKNYLLNLRNSAISILRKAFPTIKIDTSGAKSISLSEGSLSRKIDVVPANWHRTNKYLKTKEKKFRGITILDSHKMIQYVNTPFYHNYLLEIKDVASGGNLKKVIRLLKNLKADCEHNINLSSYDLTAIAYHMNSQDLKKCIAVNTILNVVSSNLVKLLYDPIYRMNLDVPDGSRKIFNSGNVNDLETLLGEVNSLREDLNALQIRINLN